MGDWGEWRRGSCGGRGRGKAACVAGCAASCRVSKLSGRLVDVFLCPQGSGDRSARRILGLNIAFM